MSTLSQYISYNIAVAERRQEKIQEDIKELKSNAHGIEQHMLLRVLLDESKYWSGYINGLKQIKYAVEIEKL